MGRSAIRFYVIGVVCVSLCFMAALSKAEESADGLWTLRTSNAAPGAGMQSWWTPSVFRSVELDTTGLDGELAHAALEGPGVDVPTQGAEITLPLPDGTFQRFAVVRKAMSADLKTLSPGLQTYCGVGLDDSEAVVACTRSVLGFQCMIRRPAGAVYIDPLWRGNDEIHAVYDYRTNTQGQTFSCQCANTAASFAAPTAGAGFSGLVSSGAQRHEFRLAIATTGEYWQFWGSNAATTAGIMATVNNVNAILENDVTVRMVLTAGRIVLNSDPTTDPYPGAGLNAEVQIDLDTNVGNANYDLGHLFHGTPGGGINGNAGCIGCICNGPNKGSGFSDGGNTPTGGNMDFLVLHEMGHQLGGRHSWTATSCAPGQWDSNASVEPGTGSTIMSYSSICAAADNILGGAVGDLYYHADSLDRIVTVTAGAACRSDVATGNGAPSVNAGADFTIPMDTPFTLFATATDPDGDPVTFCWEQMDVSPMQYPLNQPDTGANPLFRSRPPAPAPGIRWFPQFSDVLAGNFFPGTLGEQLPTTNRTMEFWVTARDNVANGGGIDQDTMNLTVDATSGPFRVLSPNGGETIPVNVPVNITWDPAGTAGGAVNMPNVQIQLWDSVLPSQVAILAMSTPNDGSWEWTPTCDQLSTNARIRVVSFQIGHSFYDISDNDFEIADITAPTVTCNLLRSVLWPARGGMYPTMFSWSVLADDCDPSTTRTLSIYSSEADGPAPFTPDWTFAAPSNLRLRAQRAFPGTGRIYIVVVNAVDASGNRGVDCCSCIVPLYPVASHLINLRLQASAAEAACLASPTDVPPPAPPGFVTLVSGIPLP